MPLPRPTWNGHALLPITAYIALLGGILLFGLIVAGRHVSFELAPASFPECEGPNIVAHVRWDATSITHQPIKVFVHKVGNPPKLWFSGAPLGDAETGKWITDGSTLELTDHKGKVLARRTMETTVCKQG